jgi:hypothetical protein
MDYDRGNRNFVRCIVFSLRCTQNSASPDPKTICSEERPTLLKYLLLHALRCRLVLVGPFRSMSLTAV